MRGLGTFAARLKRIEARCQPVPNPALAILRLFDDDEEAVVGVRAGLGQTVARRPGEPYSALVARVAADHPGRALVLVYSPDMARPDVGPPPWRLALDEAARRAAEPLSLPPAEEDLGGIGIVHPAWAKLQEE